jgi:hypothetical protein
MPGVQPWLGRALRHRRQELPGERRRSRRQNLHHYPAERAIRIARTTTWMGLRPLLCGKAPPFRSITPIFPSFAPPEGDAPGGVKEVCWFSTATERRSLSAEQARRRTSFFGNRIVIWTSPVREPPLLHFRESLPRITFVPVDPNRIKRLDWHV